MNIYNAKSKELSQSILVTTENEQVTLKPYNPLKIADDSDDGNAEEIPGEQTTIINEVNKTVSVKNS